VGYSVGFFVEEIIMRLYEQENSRKIIFEGFDCGYLHYKMNDIDYILGRDFSPTISIVMRLQSAKDLHDFCYNLFTRYFSD